MSVERGLLDTSVFIAAETGRALDTEALPDELAVSMITVGELRLGVLAATDGETRHRRLATLEAVFELDPAPIDLDVAASWARLRVVLRDADTRLAVNDSWIAATAMHLEVPVVTQDHDFPAVPGLDVVVV